MSEPSKKPIKTLQEKIKHTRENENGSIGVFLVGLLLWLIAYIVGTSSILIVGGACLLMVMVGLAGFFYYRRRYDALVEQIIGQMHQRENQDSNVS